MVFNFYFFFYVSLFLFHFMFCCFLLLYICAFTCVIPFDLHILLLRYRHRRHTHAYIYEKPLVWRGGYYISGYTSPPVLVFLCFKICCQPASHSEQQLGFTLATKISRWCFLDVYIHLGLDKYKYTRHTRRYREYRSSTQTVDGWFSCARCYLSIG